MNADTDRTRITAGAIGTAVLAGLFLAGRWTDGVEHLFVERLGPRLTALVAAPIARSSAGFAEWVEGAAILISVAFVVATVTDVIRRRGQRVAIARHGLVVAWTAVAWVLVAFELMWGLAYARPTADRRLGLAVPGEVGAPELQADELERLGLQLVDRVNDLYLELHHGWPDAFAPTEMPRSWAEIDASIDGGYARMVPILGLHPMVAERRGPTKPLVSSPLFTRLGIGGFYFPFTGEANINAMSPPWQLPHTMAHEKAHQRFVASENEANFYGWLACVHSDDPFVRYGGWLFAQRQVLFALGDTNPITFSHVVRRRLPGVQRDVNAARAFWDRYEGPLERVGDAVNDTYLKMNAVRGGIRSYGMSLQLVVAQLRARPVADLGYTGAP